MENLYLNNMLKQQLRTGGVLSDAILNLYSEFSREDFVPESMKSFAYSDLAIPLPEGQCMLTPLEEGRILQALNLQGHETVLEIGTGTGFLTALLSRLCKKLITIDYFPHFVKEAKAKLASHGCDNVDFITGDASRGWLELAPYDVVVMGGAVEKITEGHRLQIIPGGKLFAIVGKEPVMKALLLSLDHDKQWSEKLLFETLTPPLINTLEVKEFVF